MVTDHIDEDAMLQRLTERIFYIPDEPDTDRPILAGILGTDHLLMIDAGSSPDHAEIFLDLIGEATGRYPDLVALTHWHWDHTFGLSGISAPAIGHRNIAKNLSCLQHLDWDDESLSQRVRSGKEIAFCADMIRKEYGLDRDIQIQLPAILFDESLTINPGGVACELHWMPTDHSDDAVVIYVKEDKVLFLGDALGPNLYASKPYYSAPKVIEMFGFIKGFAVDWFVESHSAPGRNKDFWAENEILLVTASCILKGITAKPDLTNEVGNILGGRLPYDFEEVIDHFINGM